MQGAGATGFSLIELMFVVAIVGIISRVALPSYTKQLQKNQRAVAKARLAQAAQQLERFYSDNSSYYVDMNAGPPCVLVVNTAGSTANGFMRMMNPSWCGGASTTVYSGSNNETTSVYTIELATSSANAFTVTAKPVAGTAQAADTKCNWLTLTNTGAKGITGTGSLSDCW
jgi:type IV pilus assembly protein PilE